MAVIDAVFFDVDGTLVDSGRDIADAMNFALRKTGLKAKPRRLIISYIGTGVKDLVRRSIGVEDASLAKKVEAVFGNYYVKHSTDTSRLYPHVSEILDFLKGKRKFIITNRYKRFADSTLRKLGVRRYFEDIIGGDDEKCLKPSACVLDKALAKLKIAKERAIIVGDMAIDVQTGRNSGIKTCWVTYGLGRRRDVEPLRPDYMINDMMELRDIIR